MKVANQLTWAEMQRGHRYVISVVTLKARSIDGTI